MLHPALQRLSHSSIALLRRCPRKYQLTKLLGRVEEDSEDLSFGKAVGYGIQQLLIGVPRSKIVFDIFTMWKRDIADVSDAEERKKKTLWHVYHCLEKFERQILPTFLADYEVVILKGKAATELGFRIKIGSGFYYRGFVDVVFIHKRTRELFVLEVKTTADKWLLSAKYQNSDQALGYSLVCDFIAQQTPDIKGSSFKILYLVYMSIMKEFEQFTFSKSHSMRAHWIKQMLIEVDTVMIYEREKLWPMHGDACSSFGRACEFIDVCTMSDDVIIHGADPKIKEETDADYDFNISLLELIEAQLERHSQELTT